MWLKNSLGAQKRHQICVSNWFQMDLVVLLPRNFQERLDKTIALTKVLPPQTSSLPIHRIVVRVSCGHRHVCMLWQSFCTTVAYACLCTGDYIIWPSTRNQTTVDQAKQFWMQPSVWQRQKYTNLLPSDPRSTLQTQKNDSFRLELVASDQQLPVPLTGAANEATNP